MKTKYTHIFEEFRSLRWWEYLALMVIFVPAKGAESDVPRIALGAAGTVEVSLVTIEAVARYEPLDACRDAHLAQAVRPLDVKYQKIVDFKSGDFLPPSPAPARASLRADSYGFDLWSAVELLSGPKDCSVVLRFDIASEQSGRIVLGLGSSDQYALWKNGTIKYAVVGRRDRVRKAQDLILLELNAGVNSITLLLQRDRAWTEIPNNHFDGRQEWATAVQIFSDGKKAWAFHSTSIFHPLETPIVDQLSQLRLEAGVEEASSIALYDAAGNFVLRGNVLPSRRLSWDIPPDLKLGRPFLGFVVIDGKVGEVVLLKHGASEAEACGILAAKADPSAPAEWAFRLQHYLKPEFVATCDPWGWRRILEAFVMTSATVRTPAVAGIVAKCKALGVKLARYKSKIDGTNQYYLSYESDPGGPLRPLIVILPAPNSTLRGFLLSPTIDHIQGLEAYATVAQQVGVDLLWPGFSSVDYGGGLLRNDMAECLDHFAAGRPSNSIYHLGLCAAGFSALSAIEGGLGSGGLLLHDSIVSRRKAKWLAQLPSFDTSYPDSVLQVENASLVGGRYSRLPVRIVCDAVEEGHVDRKGLMDLQQELRAEGKDVKAYWEKRPFQTQPWGQRAQESNRILFKWAKEAFAAAQPGPAKLNDASAETRRQDVKDRLLETFYVASGDDRSLNAWADGWISRMAVYRGEPPVLRAENKTRVSLEVLETSSLAADWNSGKFKGVAQMRSDGCGTSLAGAEPLFGFRDITTSEAIPQIQVFRTGPEGVELPPLDLLLDGTCRGAIWIQRAGIWVLLEVWL